VSVYEQIAQGAPTTPANAWPVEVTDGTNVLGTPTHPVKVDPTGTTVQPVSGTVATTSASMAAPGSAVPADATYVAAKNPSGDLTGLSVDTAGSLIVTTEDNTFELTGLNVDGSGNLMVDVTDTVTVAQATPANLKATVLTQDGSGNALTSTSGALDSNLKTIGGSALSIGQKLSAASIPVVIASDQNLTVTVGAVYNNQTGTVSSGAVPMAADGTLTIISGVFTWSTLVINIALTGVSPAVGGSFQIEGSTDGVFWVPLTGTIQSSNPQQITEYSTTTLQLPLSARYNLAGFPYVRLRTINAVSTDGLSVYYALTTALGDESSYSKTELIDQNGMAIHLPGEVQYLNGAAPNASLYQSGSGQVTVPTPSNWAIPTYVLPKTPIIGDVLLVTMVIFPTTGNSWAGGPTGLQLMDTNNVVYSASYDQSTTQLGEAIVIFEVPVTQLDLQGSLGFMLYGGSIMTPAPTMNLLVQEFQNTGVGCLTFSLQKGTANSFTPTAPTQPGITVNLLVSSVWYANGPIVPGSFLMQPLGTAGDCAYGGIGTGPIVFQSGYLNTGGSDLVTINVEAVLVGTTAMGLDTVNNAVRPLSITSTGALNVNILSTGADDPALSATFRNNTGAAVSIKAAAGNLYGFSLTNSNAFPAYIEFFNSAVAPTLGTTAVVFCVPLPAAGNVTITPNSFPLMNFTAGIGFAVTTAVNGTSAAAATGMVFWK
jgi:hypothetical protein